MASNTGKGYRRGAIRGRSQIRNPRNKLFVKRDTVTGRFIKGKRGHRSREFGGSTEYGMGDGHPDFVRSSPRARPDLQPGSSRAAAGACGGREGWAETVKDQVCEPFRLPLVSWAFTTIREGLLPLALTRGRPGADRGRRSAGPRSPGVS